MKYQLCHMWSMVYDMYVKLYICAYTWVNNVILDVLFPIKIVILNWQNIPWIIKPHSKSITKYLKRYYLLVYKSSNDSKNKDWRKEETCKWSFMNIRSKDSDGYCWQLFGILIWLEMVFWNLKRKERYGSQRAQM